MKIDLLLAATMFAATPLMAQTADSPPRTDTAHVAADSAERPQTESLNNQVGANIAQAQVVAAVNQGQYEADKAAYRRAVQEHRRDVAITDDIYVRQQTAYAQAMADWRVQVAACKSGHQKACDLPTPDPANYM